MPASALALALGAAFVHALWNLLVARARDPEAAAAVVLCVAVVAFAPVAALTWDVEREVWPFVAASASFQLAYTGLLAAAYRRSELSLVYPVARGSAPVLVLVVGVAFVGASTSWSQAAGVAIVALGVLLVRGVGAADRLGFALGLATGGAIAGYTLVDKDGIEHAAAVPYLELVLIPPAIVYLAAIALVKGGGAIRAELNAAAIVAGVCTFGAYVLVLAALARAPAASVAAVRETSVVIATVLAALVLKEAVSGRRFAGAVLVAAGVILLAA